MLGIVHRTIMRRVMLACAVVWMQESKFSRMDARCFQFLGVDQTHQERCAAGAFAVDRAVRKRNAAVLAAMNDQVFQLDQSRSSACALESRSTASPGEHRGE